jgi:hypothetical protein
MRKYQLTVGLKQARITAAHDSERGVLLSTLEYEHTCTMAYRSASERYIRFTLHNWNSFGKVGRGLTLLVLL